MIRTMEIAVEKWPLVKPFVISRSIDYDATVITVTLTDEAGNRGHGESTPYARYDESTESVMADIEGARAAIEGEEKPDLAALGLKGAAANAVDCALIDLAAKQSGKPAWELLGQPEPGPLLSTVTVILGEPEEMAKDAVAASAGGLLKIKLGAADGRDMERLEAIRAAVPDVRLFCDANEGWDLAALIEYGPTLKRLGIEMVEQPLPAGQDQDLAGLDYPVKLCADESCHVAADIPNLVGLYDLVNVKLDKTGGLTPALELVKAAREADMGIMVGCMLSTSLAMAPALIASQGAVYSDLDAPFAISEDRVPPMEYVNGWIQPASPELWG